VLSAEHMTMRAAEGEFGFRITHDLAARDEPFGRDEVLAAIGALHPAIEVPDTRFDDFIAVGLPSLVADAMCGGFVALGPPATGWDPDQLPGHAASPHRHGRRDGGRLRRARPRRGRVLVTVSPPVTGTSA
jgi:2-keto-4-pentenoate hydratase